jgi:dienelactone hydrolase
MRIVLILFAWVVAVAEASSAPAVPSGEQVEIMQGAAILKGLLYRPEGPGPFPAVVAMHGCGGLYNRDNTVNARYHDWAKHLIQAGFVVLFPDSYGSRGLGPQCRTRNRPIRTERERVADANSALHWLQAQSYVERNRVSLLGWSNGAISVLWTVRRRGAMHEEAPDFRSAIAFYPGCSRPDNAAWSARVPTLILMGKLDDWVSAELCEKMVAGARGRSARISLVVYPGAYHDFDHPNRPVQVRTGYAYSIDGSGRVHTGSNPVARADALKRVQQWLAR